METRLFITVFLVLSAAAIAGADEVMDSYWADGKQLCEFQTVQGLDLKQAYPE